MAGSVVLLEASATEPLHRRHCVLTNNVEIDMAVTSYWRRARRCRRSFPLYAPPHHDRWRMFHRRLRVTRVRTGTVGSPNIQLIPTKLRDGRLVADQRVVPLLGRHIAVRLVEELMVGEVASRQERLARRRSCVRRKVCSHTSANGAFADLLTSALSKKILSLPRRRKRMTDCFVSHQQQVLLLSRHSRTARSPQVFYGAPFPETTDYPAHRVVVNTFGLTYIFIRHTALPLSHNTLYRYRYLLL